MSIETTLPPAKHRWKVVFQGDSITDAFRRPEEINPAYQLGAGYALLAGAELARLHPGRVELINRGVSGHTARDLLARWEQDTIVHDADIVSILAGVNSTIRHFIGEESEPEEEFGLTFSRLLESLLSARPSTRIVILEPFLVPAGCVTPEWSQHLRPRQRIVRELATRHGAAFVPLQALFDEACTKAAPEWWAYDGIHPTHAGASLIAMAWMETVAPWLPSSETLMLR